MTGSFHGHEVMQMMLQSGKIYTRETLIQDIEEVFGKEATFHTCSAINMTADELIDFLDSRGKILPMDQGFTTDPSKICNHS